MQSMKRVALSLAGVVWASAGAAPIDELSWLAGCWRAERGDAGSGEHWMVPAAGSLFGMARTVRSGRTVAHEFMQIRESAGALVFIAMPSAKPSASFRALRVEPRRVVFENPDKDFPQRVGYESPDDATLIGHIEGLDQGRERRIEFPMRREACPSGAAR